MLHLLREMGKICWCSCWKEGNFILIYEFKYGQTWKICLYPLSLSLKSTFKRCLEENLCHGELWGNCTWWFVFIDYISDCIFINFVFIIEQIFVISYISIWWLYICFICFIDILKAEWCCLYHNGTDKAHETMFSLLFTLLVIIWYEIVFEP